MLLQGSCHCGAVSFDVQSRHPYPFNRCYCQICRKTAGGGGFAINLDGDADTLNVRGLEHTSVYQAKIDGETSSAKRHFCRHCASALWLYDDTWPEHVHPFASAIDSDLPTAPERTHMMLGSKPAWVDTDTREGDLCFDEYPDESLAQWHEHHGLT
ncbi:GFA family protein [Marinimicrobium sp. ABcell2]|uniref:GFA family protein n=1 Tax=Marinimicrobium sp. ABcell2 TaxID=3069751 RepID=UPI0027B7EBE4|nr:GFA family protein [Marinimicrobium sp. ABcell2]MDQ2076017.1 GFA family protein [Marinimicrobium sp. ABcell2]